MSDIINYNLASTSDHAPFYQRLGVPTSYMLWRINVVSLSFLWPLRSAFSPVQDLGPSR